MIRFSTAMALLAAVAALAWTTMSANPIPGLPAWVPDWVSFRAVALLILAMFAFKAWVFRQREMLEARAKSQQVEKPM